MGTITAKPHGGGRKAAIRGKQVSKLKSLLRRCPDATIEQVREHLGDVTSATVCRTLNRIGWTLKTARYKQTERGVFRSPFCNPVFTTKCGRLYEADCMQILPRLPDGSAAMVFADPPFNLGKMYGPKSRDRRPEQEYIRWCQSWLRECVRVLRVGGSLFLFHVPKMAMQLGSYLVNDHLRLLNWIAIDYNLGVAIPNRLTPRHYALLYFAKGIRQRSTSYATRSRHAATVGKM